MQIDRIRLKDVGPFQDVTIELPRGSDPALADVYLLTGPNGSGKTTILYALASLLACGQPGLAPDLLTRRFRSGQAFAALAAGEIHWVVTPATVGTEPLPRLRDPLGTEPLEWAVEAGPLGFRGNGPGISEYARHATSSVPSSAPTFSWAAFAYAGKRSLEQGRGTAISEVIGSPFDHSLSFTETADTAQLTKWIISQQFKRLKAKDAGRFERAEQLGHSIRETERLIGQIVGDDDFGFATSDEDNDVRIRWHGNVVDLDLLPDGLKSITSWVADLLMRLDRIPWVGDVPVLQRAFLLLLDEVDIHLHPAWQRQVLPFVQRMFPNAQIIATTHSPFVVASVADAHVVTFAIQDGVSTVENVASSQLGVSYSAVLRSIFGIDSEFDATTENDFRTFHEAKARLLRGEPGARSEVDRVASQLAARSEEVKELVALELAQLKRQLARLAP